METSGSKLRKRSGSTNKPRCEFQLPKINKTSVLLKGKENSSILQTFSQKIQWIGINVDYQMMSDKQIVEEYGKLRKQLSNINAEVAKAIEKVNIKSIRQKRMTEIDPTRTLEVQDKEIENNEAILSRIRKEYFQLQKRATTISLADSKLSLDQQIQATKKQCDKIKSKIKEIKLKNKSIGDSITNTDDLYEEIHRLESQKDVSLKRKLKLHNKNEHVIQQICAFQLKLEDISDNCAIAQNYFEQYDNKIQESQKRKQLQQKLRQVKHNFEIMNKKNEILCNTKQQKYHATLKTFQNQMQRLDLVQQKISSLELQTIHCKKVIKDYEILLKQNAQRREQFETIQEKPIFYTEVKQNTINSLCQNQQTKNTQNPISQTKIEEQSYQNDGSRLVKGAPFQKQGSQEQHQEQQIVNEKVQMTKSRASQIQNSIPIKAETNKSIDPEEQEDIIMELDQKFKSSPRNLRRSRYNERETQVGQEIGSDSVIDEDEEILEFKNKIKEEQWKRNSKEELAIHMSELNSQLQSVNIIKSNPNHKIPQMFK